MRTRQSVPRAPRPRCQGGEMGESEGQRRWVGIQAQSPPLRLGGAAGADDAAQGPRSPGPAPARAGGRTRSHAPPGSKDAKRGRPGAEVPLRRGKGSERARPALPGIPPDSRNPKVPKIRKRNCKQVSRSLGTVSPASRRRPRTPDTTSAVKGGRPGGGDRSARPPCTSPGHRPPASGAPRVALGAPGSKAVVGRVPPAPSRKKGKLGPYEKPVTRSLPSVTHSLPRRGSVQSRGFRGLVGRDRALVSGDVRRRRGGFPAETAVYEHRAILGRFPLRRSPRESCPREAARTAPAGSAGDALRARPRGGGRKASGPRMSPTAQPRCPGGRKICCGGQASRAAPLYMGRGGDPHSGLLQMPRDHVTALTTDLDDTVI
ncbi:collagen alpha-1(I) chain-like [Pteropus medius]|uniref:collagen alpha-1(I) chain-like n=1 Tax=Pteropus vampyrus TaxID=132908 RepID=UPI00196B1B9B|nr:collagen alpha-1(I) chain-like [Pteropus giganteus]